MQPAEKPKIARCVPKDVIIQGKIVPVVEMMGGYVTVGKSYADIPVFKKQEAQSLRGEAHVIKWRAYMWEAFQKAAQLERQRIKKLKG